MNHNVKQESEKIAALTPHRKLDTLKLKGVRYKNIEHPKLFEIIQGKRSVSPDNCIETDNLPIILSSQLNTKMNNMISFVRLRL